MANRHEAHPESASQSAVQQELRERLRFKLRHTCDLWPGFGDAVPPEPLTRPYTETASFGREWAELVQRWQNGEYKLPQSESLEGLEGPINSTGTCLDPILSSGQLMWFDPRKPAQDGDIVLVHWDAAELQPFIDSNAHDPEWLELYGQEMRSGAHVVKLLKAADWDYWLVQNSGSGGFPLGKNRILGVLAHVEKAPSQMVAAVSVAPPSGLTATAIPAGIRLSWTNPASRLFDWIDVYASTSSAWGSASLIGSTRSNTMDVTKNPGTTQYFWVRARNFANIESDRYPNSDTSTVTETATPLSVRWSTAAGTLSGFSGVTTYHDLTVLEDGGGGGITSGPTTVLEWAPANGTVSVIGSFIGSKGASGTVSVYPYMEDISTSPVTVTVGSAYPLTTTDKPFVVQGGFTVVEGHRYRIGMRALSSSASNIENYTGPVITQVFFSMA